MAVEHQIIPKLVKLGEDKPEKRVHVSHFNPELLERLKKKAYKKYLTFSIWELTFYTGWGPGKHIYDPILEKHYYMDIVGLGVWNVTSFEDIYNKAQNIIVYYHNDNGIGVKALCYLK